MNVHSNPSASPLLDFTEPQQSNVTPPGASLHLGTTRQRGIHLLWSSYDQIYRQAGIAMIPQHGGKLALI
ncbi:hypothetical protein BS47DRAFT_1345648 [Hydnum rufescens UP504]|uniref:Uncharacterized protein n=1 Tax=Hydnum rufescens UP504 TaxID=1448309 RepID=A0A9P6DW11_9AGAM|nr:hypothetical protein BS47DRAFT_1345648 [Hydnum rufescens UP504]